MQKEKVDQFMLASGKNFPELMVNQIREKLTSLDDNKADMLLCTSWKDTTIGLLFAIFLGGLGVDRFWLGQAGLGVLKLLTCGGAGIWWLIDLFTVSSRTKEANYNKLMTLL